MEVKPGLIPDGWEAKTLGDICGWITTGKIDANAMVADGTHFLPARVKNYWIDKYAFDCEALLVSGNGAMELCLAVSQPLLTSMRTTHGTRKRCR
jgi:hypothetical protein